MEKSNNAPKVGVTAGPSGTGVTIGPFVTMDMVKEKFKSEIPEYNKSMIDNNPQLFNLISDKIKSDILKSYKKQLSTINYDNAGFALEISMPDQKKYEQKVLEALYQGGGETQIDIIDHNTSQAIYYKDLAHTLKRDNLILVKT